MVLKTVSGVTSRSVPSEYSARTTSRCVALLPQSTIRSGRTVTAVTRGTSSGLAFAPSRSHASTVW